MPTLGKLIAQPMLDEAPPILSFKQKVDRWMINEGSRRMYFDSFTVLILVSVSYLFCYMSWSIRSDF
jgi:hypothetical protein